MKPLMTALAGAAALLSSTSAQAVVPIPTGNYTFSLTADCEDCARIAETDFYPVSGSLSVVNYALGTPLTLANFGSFTYNGSNLIPGGFTWNSATAFFGSIDTAPGSYDVFIESDGMFFATGSSSVWNTGPVNMDFDRGFSAIWNGSVTQPGVPEPATWALLIAGFAMVGAAMRKRAKVSYSFS